MDRPDVQFAVKTLASYMSKPTIKALSALKHLASYLDGTADDGLLLQSADEGQCIFDAWRDDEWISDEISVPSDQATARFNIDAFSDSSWADCKTTRKSTSSGLVFLNGAMILSICRTQASVALSSCEAELYAANGLMVECMFLYRLCKFLCKDSSETNSEDVQQRLYTDSSSAMALVQRAGTGRLKHVQIRQFYLQNLLRAGIFTIHKINTKCNPSDLNTKRLSSERRRFLGRLIGIGLFMASERNDDSEIRQIRRVNRVTRQQCVRLVQMATAALGICSQLKGCNSVSGWCRHSSGVLREGSHMGYSGGFSGCDFFICSARTSDDGCSSLQDFHLCAWVFSAGGRCSIHLLWTSDLGTQQTHALDGDKDARQNHGLETQDVCISFFAVFEMGAWQ